MQEYDRSSKWLIEHHGDAILKIAGVQGITSWQALTPEVVQPRQMPDGVIEAEIAGEDRPVRFVVEIGTFPEQRVLEQVRRAALLVLLDRGELPEVITLILHPKGQYRVPGEQEVGSRLGGTRLRLHWRVVELWTLPAIDLLSAGDVGAVPWATLARHDGPPEDLFQQCRERIDREALADERASLLAVSQVLAGLRYNDPRLLGYFTGSQAMPIESPVLAEWMGQRMHRAIMRILVERFKIVPPEVEAAVRAIYDDRDLDQLNAWAAVAPDLATFGTRIPPPSPVPDPAREERERTQRQ